jgi:predicted homoserine dehydrogenase-like protein
VIIVDQALGEREADGRPVRVGMVGAGFMGQGLTNQIENSVPGMRMAAIYNRRPERAVDVYAYAGREGVRTTESQREFDDLAARGVPVVAEDPYLLCRSPHIDILVDVTGSVEFGAHVILEAFANGKSVVLMNAEVDATIGPVLRQYAAKHGVILSACDGDEPGLQMNLVRWVAGLGLTPRVVCNVKGLQDPYRDPTTQAAWAERWEQNPAMVTSFADGSKISFEQAIVANATGFSVLQRGMSRGQAFEGSVMDTPALYDVDELRRIGGAINYTVGPSLVKAYVLAEHPDPKQQHYLELYKMGPGPLYPFWVPYHLVHFETPFSIARVALFRDELAPPLGGPVVEVCAVAKRDLEAGEVLDDYGMYLTYGEATNVDEMSSQRYLPEGLVEGCRLVRDVAQDQVLKYDDVDLPPDRLADRLRAEQYARFRVRRGSRSIWPLGRPCQRPADDIPGSHTLSIGPSIRIPVIRPKGACEYHARYPVGRCASLFREPTPIEPGGSHDGSLSSRSRRGGPRTASRSLPTFARATSTTASSARRWRRAHRDASRDAAEVGRLRIRPRGPGPWGLVSATIAPSAGCPTTTRTSPWGSRRSWTRARLPAAVRTALEPVTIDRVSRADGGFRLELSDGELVHARRVVVAVGIWRGGGVSTRRCGQLGPPDRPAAASASLSRM